MFDKAFDLDHEQVIRAIDRAEVLSIFFPWFGKALIVDTRHSPTAPPAVFTDGMVNSVEERMRSIAHHRPEFSHQIRLLPLPWPAGVGSFLDSGVYDRIVQRLTNLGHGYLTSDCERALADLRRAERRVKLSYVRGDHCRTLYQRPRWER